MKRVYIFSLLALAGAIGASGQETPEEPGFKP